MKKWFSLNLFIYFLFRCFTTKSCMSLAERDKKWSLIFVASHLRINENSFFCLLKKHLFVLYAFIHMSTSLTVCRLCVSRKKNRVWKQCFFFCLSSDMFNLLTSIQRKFHSKRWLQRRVIAVLNRKNLHNVKTKTKKKRRRVFKWVAHK